MPPPGSWLRSALTSRWWGLPADQFRVAITLVALAELRGGRPVINTTADHLAHHCHTDRSTVRRTLVVLESIGFCVVETSRGRAGQTTITLVDSRPFVEASEAHETSTEDLHGARARDHLMGTSTQKTQPFDSGLAGQLNGHSEVIETVCESQENPGDRGHLISHLIPASATNNSPITSEGAAPPVLDLKISSDPGSDLSERSSASRDLQALTKKRRLTPERAALIKTGLDALGQMSSQAAPSTASAQPVDNESEGDRPKRRVDPDKVPDRAWAAADYLRAQVLTEDPSSVVGRKAWDATQRTGLRLAWANSFRLLHEVDRRDWDEIARTVGWLFKQSGPARFVVQSPDTLREKWDRIQAVRRNQAQPTPNRDQRPDPQANRKFKPLGEP